MGADPTDISNKVTIKIKSINTVIIDGNTYYFIEASDDTKYKVSIKVNESILPFLRVGQEIVVYHNNGATLKEISKIE
jgi:translation elongation factor P/translation initiation factor 5A